MGTWFARTMVGVLLCVCAACGRQGPSETSQVGNAPPPSETSQVADTPPPSETSQVADTPYRRRRAPTGRTRDARKTYQIGSTPYQLSTTIHHAPGGCGDEFSFRDKLYSHVRVMDPELEARIDDVERRTEQILGSNSRYQAEEDLNGLAQREFRSGVEPLSETERLRLERLRDDGLAEWRPDFELLRLESRASFDGFATHPDPLSEAERLRLAHLQEAKRASAAARAELEALESRVPLSGLESEMLRQGPELLDTWNRLINERRWTTDPSSMPVYENERLVVGLYEDDLFADDRCLSAVIRLDRATLDKGSLELGRGVMTLEFAAVP